MLFHSDATVHARRGDVKARDLPFVGGQEGGGTIAATTPKAEAMGMKVGDRVAYSILQSYSEYVCNPRCFSFLGSG